MRKLVIYAFTVLLPAIVVGISNFTVFPDSAWAATIMLVVTAEVAGVFTYFSGDATARVRRYCIIADIAICAVLCFNLGGHWILNCPPALLRTRSRRPVSGFSLHISNRQA